MTSGMGGGEISIHAPREGSDLLPLSTSREAWDFYPRSPRGERHLISGYPQTAVNFYPRSPRGERPSAHRPSMAGLSFLSTLPARGATRGCYGYRRRLSPISIHAPREGSDHIQGTILHDICHFYPRSPRGERQVPNWVHADFALISIHAPREGSDHPLTALQWQVCHFYPRSPRGERR